MRHLLKVIEIIFSKLLQDYVGGLSLCVEIAVDQRIGGNSAHKVTNEQHSKTL